MLRQALLRRVPATARPCLQRCLSVSSSSGGSGGSSGPVRFGRLAAALPGYVEEYGHGWVPRSHVNSADGYTMGIDAARARKLERRGTLRDGDVEALIDEGFLWEVDEHRWDRVVNALTTFGELHSKAGWLAVPTSFVVPSKAPWHKMCWGMRLGNTVNNIRAQEIAVKDRPERRAWLDSLGFVGDDREHRWTEVVQPALLAYRTEFGDLRVPKSFVVPSKGPWPEACWGMKLGHTVSVIRGQEVFVKDRPERRAWLDSLGFVWSGRNQTPKPSKLARGSK